MTTEQLQEKVQKAIQRAEKDGTALLSFEDHETEESEKAGMILMDAGFDCEPKFQSRQYYTVSDTDGVSLYLTIVK